MSRRCLICSNLNPCHEHSESVQDAELARNSRAVRELQSTPPVVEEGRREAIAQKLISIADASRRNDGSDIPLGETLREAAQALSAPPTVQGNEVREALSTLYSILTDSDGDSAWEKIQRGQMLITSTLATLGALHEG